MVDKSGIHLRHAQTLYEQIGDQTDLGRCHHALSRLAELQSQWDAALHHARRALAEFRDAGWRGGQAMALTVIGGAQAHLGCHQQAITSCRQAIAWYHESGHRNYGEADAWDTLGYTYRRIGRYARAVGCYQRAIDLNRELGYRYSLAGALVGLGDVQDCTGNRGTAVIAWLEALLILETVRHPDTAR